MVVQAAATPVHNDDNNAGPDHAREEKLLDAEESLAMRKLLVSLKYESVEQTISCISLEHILALGA